MKKRNEELTQQIISVISDHLHYALDDHLDNIFRLTSYSSPPLKTLIRETIEEHLSQ